VSNTSQAIEEIICTRVHEYADDKMSDKDKKEFENQLKENGGSAFVDKFNTYRGKLQGMVSSEHLSVKEQHALHAYVEDPTARHTQEIAKINEIGKAHKATKVKRLSFLVVGLVLLIACLAYVLIPSSPSNFRPLEFLSWEAQSMMNDPEDKLIIKSNLESDVSGLFRLDKSLTFKPTILNGFSSNYQIEGARIVKYEGIADITAVQYAGQNSRRLVHFQYAGLLSDLPSAEPGNMLGLIYHTYSTDELNMIAWQASSNVVSLLVGFDGAEELARFANSSK